MPDQGEGHGLDSEGDLGPMLVAARRAAPALTPSRSQKWRWALLSRLDNRPRSRTPAVAAACAAAAVLAIIGWRHHSASELSAPARQPTTASGQHVLVLGDGSRVL